MNSTTPASPVRQLIARNGGKLPWIVFLALVLSSVYVQQLHFATSNSKPPDDFPVYYIAAKIAATGTRQPLYYPSGTRYSLREILEPGREPGTLWDQTARAAGLGPTLHFLTPPFTALIMEPLSRFPWQRAYLVWTWLSDLMLIASIYFALRLARAKPFWPWFAVCGAAGFAFFPFIQGLWLGQIDGLILITWTLGAYLWSRHRPVASAFCFAVGTMVKVTPVLAVGLFVIRRQWRWLAAYCAWMAVLLGVSIWQLGLQNHLDWLRTVYPALSCGAPYFENRSISSFLLALFNGGVFVHGIPQSVPALLCLIGKVTSAAVYLGALYLLWKKNRKSDGLAFELLTIAVISLAVSPISWRHYFVLALLPLVYLWVVALGEKGSGFEVKLLALITLWFGVKAPEYMLLKVRFLSLLEPAGWVAVTLLFFWLCLRMYRFAALPDSDRESPASRTPDRTAPAIEG